MSTTTEIMPALEHARDALLSIPSVVSCKVGLEKNMSPADYPMIRVVPSRVVPGAAYSGRSIEAFIYFGTPLTEAEGLEDVYNDLSTLEAEIVSTLKTISGRYIETLTDEDRLDTYKIMAIRCELKSPDFPHTIITTHATSVALPVDSTPAVLAPFTTLLHSSGAADWTPNLPAGSITRLLNGATATRTRVTITGYVAGADGDEVTIGVYGDGEQTGNRATVRVSGPGVPIAFELVATYYAEADVALDVRAASGASANFTFTDVKMVAQKTG